MINYYEFFTEFGDMAIYFNQEGLYALSFLGSEGDKNYEYIRKNFQEVVQVEEDILGYAEEIQRYIMGEVQDFSIPVHFFGTEFQKKVWNALLEIPYGEVRTYKELASSIGCEKGYRAVGGALNKNPIGIVVPCHRVIGSDGNLVGFAGGLSLKERLLQLERDNIKD